MIGPMKNHDGATVSFDFAEALWSASMHVIVRPDPECVRSSTLFRTTSGIVVKRDAVPLRRRALPPAGPKWYSSSFVLLATGLIGAVVVLFLAAFSR